MDENVASFVSESVVNDGNLCLSDDDWSHFACHVANIAVKDARGFAAAATIMAVSKLSFLPII